MTDDTATNEEEWEAWVIDCECGEKVEISPPDDRGRMSTQCPTCGDWFIGSIESPG
jgi:hypothetical protein